MNHTQNDRLKQVTSDTLIVVVDIGSQTHYCRAFDWRGFGRFARNVLEQAMMRQADRVVKTAKGKPISKRNLTRLIADDFDVNAEKQYDKKQKVIGFV